MKQGQGWRRTFLAVSTLLGEPLDVAAATLGDDGPRILAGPLGSGPREDRGAAVARIVAALMAELEQARLA